MSEVTVHGSALHLGRGAGRMSHDVAHDARGLRRLVDPPQPRAEHVVQDGGHSRELDAAAVLLSRPLHLCIVTTLTLAHV